MENTSKVTETVPARSVTLKKGQLIKLCEIIEKATEGDPSPYVWFELSGKGRSVESRRSGDLLAASWPREVEEVSLVAQSYKIEKKISVHLSNGVIPFNEIAIVAMDSDWVTSRRREIEEFIADHRNCHWMFHHIGFPALQGSLLWGLPAYRLMRLISDSKLLGLVIAGAFALVWAYVWGMSKLFPFTFIDTERPSTLAGLRKVVKYAVPSVIAGLVMEFVIRFILLLV